MGLPRRASFLRAWLPTRSRLFTAIGATLLCASALLSGSNVSGTQDGTGPGGFEGASHVSGGPSAGYGGFGVESPSRQAGGDTAPLLCADDKERSVLFVGNSYTHYFEMPRLLSEMAESAGCTLYTEYVAPGGSRLSQHAQSDETLSAIGSRDWDAVVLQNFSQVPSQPLKDVERNTMAAIRTLVQNIRHNRPETELYYYVTWGRRDGDKKYCKENPMVCTFEGHTEALHRGYSFYARETGGRLVDVGGAWAKIKRDPHRAFSYRQLYDSDGSHPSLKGSYLVASMFFSALMHRSPVGLSYPQGLSPSAAKYIQSVAASTPLSGA